MRLVVPIGIKAAKQWEEALVDALALIDHWGRYFDAMSIEELSVF
jgi:hypothetical protein